MAAKKPVKKAAKPAKKPAAPAKKAVAKKPAAKKPVARKAAAPAKPAKKVAKPAAKPVAKKAVKAPAKPAKAAKAAPKKAAPATKAPAKKVAASKTAPKSVAKPAAKPANKQATKQADKKKATKTAAAAATAATAAESHEDDVVPDLAGANTVDYQCALGAKVTLYENLADNQHIAMRWGKELRRLKRVETSTGAQRFENRKHGLVWIGIPSKGMLLDSKKGQQLANVVGDVSGREVRLAHGELRHVGLRQVDATTLEIAHHVPNDIGDLQGEPELGRILAGQVAPAAENFHADEPDGRRHPAAVLHELRVGRIPGAMEVHLHAVDEQVERFARQFEPRDERLQIPSLRRRWRRAAEEPLHLVPPGGKPGRCAPRVGLLVHAVVHGTAEVPHRDDGAAFVGWKHQERIGERGIATHALPSVHS